MALWRTGLCQVVFRPEVDSTGHEKAKQIRSEDVIAVRGIMAKRSPETINPELATGASVTVMFSATEIVGAFMTSAASVTVIVSLTTMSRGSSLTGGAGGTA